MSKEFQNMDPNSATSLDDDHTKFRARFERLATLSLGYDPSLLQASPNSSSTVSRSPLQPVKIRTDWSRPDLDEDLDSDLNSSGICQFSLNNFEESRISRADSHESEPHEVGYAGTLTSILDLEQVSVPSSPLMSETAPEKCPEIEVQTGLSTLLHTASDNDSDMDMSSICDISIADRTEGEILMSSANAACGEITASEPESDHGCLSEHILSKDDKASEKASGESVSSNCSAMADFPLPECEPSPSLDARQHDDRSLFTLERFEDVAKLSESESENLPHFINMTPSRRNPLSKSVEGTPARALFPARAHSVEGTPLKSSGLISRGASVSSSLNIEGTPSKRNRAIDQVVSEVPELVSRLNSKHDDWTRRFEALKRISKFTTFHISAASLSEALLPLIEPLALQLQDLRSQIVKQACIAIGDLAVYLGVQFQPFARRLVPRLLDLLRIAKKVMSSSSDSCLRRIICHSHVDGLSIILNEAICNKSPIVRCRCLEYSLLALQSWDISELISYKAVISSFFSKVCSDSTKDVRTAGKRLFNEFAIVWPEDSRDLFQTFDVKLQKGILTEYPALKKIVSFSDDDFIAGSDFLSLQTTPSRPSLAEVKAALRRGSLSSACGDNDILFVEKSSAAFSDDVNLSCSHQLSTSDVPKTPEKCSKKIERDNLSNHVMGSPTYVLASSSSLSFKFDQSHPSAIHDRDRLAPALSPIPVEFLEGFPVPAPLRSSVPSDSVPMMSDPSPLVKHSSRRFTSRIFGTPINGKLDNAANDDDSSSSSSSCPTVEQSFDEADETGHLSVSSSIAAESLDVLCREAAPVDSIDVEQPTKSRESVLLLQSKLQYLRTMATSVFDECTSPVRTIEIHHDLTAASLQPLYQTESIKSNCLEAKSDTQLNRSPAASHNGVEHPILIPPKSDLKCDSTLQVGNLSFGASKSPKDVLNAVLSSPSSEHVFRSPDRNPVPAPSKPSFVKPSDVDDSSTLRSVLFILLSLIMFAILFHGLPEFLRPQSDELISKSKLHYSESHDDSAISTSLQHFSKIDIPIRDSGSVIYESFDSEEAMDEEDEVASSSNPQLNNFVPNEPDQSQLVYSSSDPLVQGDLGGSVLRESSKELSAFIEDAPSDFDETISNSASKSGTHEPAKDFNQMSEIAAESPSNQNVSSFATSDSHPRQANVTYHLHDVSVSAYAFRDDPDSVRTGFETESVSVKTGSEFGPDSVETGSESAPDSVETGSETESGDASGFSIPLTPQLAYLYSIFVTMICWLTYRFRTGPAPPRVADRDPDFDLTGVTMAPEWDINLDSVLPSGPSPLPSPGGTDYQKWNHIKKDGTTMTLFSPLRRTLRIRRPRRPTQF